jgi:hypothetical protein
MADGGAHPTAELLSFKPYRFVQDAPKSADELDAERGLMPWWAPVAWFGLAAMCWGLIALIWAVLP